ncbi:MAG: hypothetical protein AB8I08_02260 [Sandaracinaceae bacterium]
MPGRSMFPGLTLALAACALLVAGQADAQVAGAQCEAGRVATSEGYCCWPGQSWSASLGRCNGPPSCPSPRVAAGAECVEPSVVDLDSAEPVEVSPVAVESPEVLPEEFLPPDAEGGVPSSPAAHWLPPPTQIPVEPEAPSTIVTAPHEPVGSAWPSSATRPSGAGVPRDQEGVDAGRLGGGLAMLLGGYALSITAAVALLEYDAPFAPNVGGAPMFGTMCHDQAAAWSLVPIVGALIGGIHVNECHRWEYRRYGSGLAYPTEVAPRGQEAFAVLGTVSSLAQVLGLGIVITAVLEPNSFVVWEGEDGASLALHASGGSDGGLVGARGRLP